MIIRPNQVKIENMYMSLKNGAKKGSNVLIPLCTLCVLFIPILIAFLSLIMDEDIYFEDFFPLIPILLIIGVVIGLILKPFFYNFILKENAKFVSEVKNTGISIDGDLITGRMLKVDTTTPVNNIVKTQETLPRKSFDVAFKISNISNIEISDKILANVDYGKLCIVTLGAEKYYMMCLEEAEAVELRNIVLNFRV